MTMDGRYVHLFVPAHICHAVVALLTLPTLEQDFSSLRATSTGASQPTSLTRQRCFCGAADCSGFLGKRKKSKSASPPRHKRAEKLKPRGRPKANTASASTAKTSAGKKFGVGKAAVASKPAIVRKESAVTTPKAPSKKTSTPHQSKGVRFPSEPASVMQFSAAKRWVSSDS